MKIEIVLRTNKNHFLKKYFTEYLLVYNILCNFVSHSGPELNPERQ
jgi:hypothetical protein